MIRKSEVGQALVLTALALVALLGVLGLAIDMGVLRYDKRLQQTAADAAALAGASNLAFGSTAGGPSITTAARGASQANGFADTSGDPCQTPPTNLDIGSVAVTVCNPPIYGPHTGDAHYVEAYVSAGQPTYFMKILGVDKETVTARAVATVNGGNEKGGGCLWTLGPPTASIEGVNVNGNPTLNAPTCGITDNGNFNTKGNALEVTASTFAAAGDWINHGTQPNDVTCTSGQSPCPGDMVGVSDPLASKLTAPSAGTPVYTLKISGNSNSTGGCNTTTNCNYANGVYTISPGTYCSITITGTTSAAIVNFASGIYIIEGTDDGCTTQSLNIPGNGTISGDGVMFYFTGTSTLNMTGTPTMQLTGMPDGSTYAGMLMWQDPNDTNTDGPAMGGNSGSYYDGMVYFPKDQLTFYGNNTSMSVSMVITYSVQLSGNPTVNLEGAATMPAGTNPIVTPSLVE